MKTITADDLKNLGATCAGLDWFRQTFPAGTTLDEAWAACPDPQWQVWYGTQVLPMTMQQALAYKFAGLAFRIAAIHCPALATYADNVTAKNVAEAMEKAEGMVGEWADEAAEAEAAAEADWAAEAARNEATLYWATSAAREADMQSAAEAAMAVGLWAECVSVTWEALSKPAAELCERKEKKP